MDEGGRYNVPSLVVPASSLMGLCIYMCSLTEQRIEQTQTSHRAFILKRLL